MENNIFLRPAVAGIMKENFVEARHHTDIQNTLTEAQFAANRKLQEEIAITKANPYFVVVDPKTGKKIGEHALSGGPNAWEGNWIEFLQQVLKAAGR
ncbi:MAG TPA: hypothetical protein VFD82_15780 [Planctomycetota bacterium]|jgi:hypothetical protein|nr:hypothetical protein [Planctomycetota bacterium]